jgi:hypothetical protein
MTSNVQKMVPDCGLYRTTELLAGHESEFPAGTLVYFHNHSEAGPPEVFGPQHNVHNRWHFHGPGVVVRTLAWTRTLEKVPEQGFYVLTRELSFEGGVWPKGALVQLGYTRGAEPILFIAQLRGRLEENVLWFSDRGVGVTRDRLAELEPVSVYEEPRGDDEEKDQTPHLH